MRPYVFTRDRVDNIVGRCTQELRDDGELVYVILAGEERLALQHLGEDATSTPDVHLDIVFLPREHDLGRPVVSRRDISCHLWVLDARQTKIADLEIAVFVYEDVAGFQVSMHDPGRMDILQTSLVVCPRQSFFESSFSSSDFPRLHALTMIW